LGFRRAAIGGACRRADGQAERASEAGFDRGDADFAVALRAMPVANGKQGAAGEDGKMHNRAFDELLLSLSLPSFFTRC
jgi:hypothetical protein